jgi:hypothetical protein
MVAPNERYFVILMPASTVDAFSPKNDRGRLAHGIMPMVRRNALSSSHRAA